MTKLVSEKLGKLQTDSGPRAEGAKINAKLEKHLMVMQGESGGKCRLAGEMENAVKNHQCRKGLLKARQNMIEVPLRRMLFSCLSEWKNASVSHVLANLLKYQQLGCREYIITFEEKQQWL